MLKHFPLRWWEVLKLPIKPGLHQQKDIEIARKRCICGKASPEKRPLQLACRSGHPQYLLEALCQHLAPRGRYAEAPDNGVDGPRMPPCGGKPVRPPSW